MATAKLWVRPTKPMYRRGKYIKPGEPFELPPGEKPTADMIPLSEHKEEPVVPVAPMAMSEIGKITKASSRKD